MSSALKRDYINIEEISDERISDKICLELLLYSDRFPWLFVWGDEARLRVLRSWHFSTRFQFLFKSCDYLSCITIPVYSINCTANRVKGLNLPTPWRDLVRNDRYLTMIDCVLQSVEITKAEQLSYTPMRETNDFYGR